MKNRINSTEILNKAYQEQLAHPKGTKGLKAAQDMFNSNAEVIDRLILNLRSSNKLTIADIGCGPAYSLMKLNEICNNCTIIGIDNSELVLRIARKNISTLTKNSRENKLELLYGATPKLPCKNSSLDSVILSNIVYFWKDIAIHIKNISEKLKKEGTALVYLTDPEDLKARIDQTANVYNFYSVHDLQLAFLNEKIKLEKQDTFTRENGQLGHIAIFKKY
jgi:ubiquinone/menaquinone biosynthesis C-methylase UbiE